VYAKIIASQGWDVFRDRVYIVERCLILRHREAKLPKEVKVSTKIQFTAYKPMRKSASCDWLYVILLDYILIANFFLNYIVMLWKIVTFAVCFAPIFLHCTIIARYGRPICNRADHYIFILFLLLLLFLLISFFSSPNLSGRRLDVYHTSTHGVALVQI